MSEPEANERRQLSKSGEGLIIGPGALNTFLRNARNCGSVISKAQGIVVMTELRCAV